MYEALLEKAGLTTNQALVYELLLREGQSKASKISQKSPIKRGLVYKVLDELVDLKLAKKEDPDGAVATFTAEHPDALRQLITQRQAEVERAQSGMEQLLPQLTSEFNLAMGKPGVRFYEGEEGVKKVWWDSLETDQEIYTYLDLEAVGQHFAKLNTAYFKERQRRNISKKAITNDSAFNREFLKDYDKALTRVRLMKNSAADFSAVTMHIYANKISYTRLSGRTMIGLIIEDPLIYQMHRMLFEAQWRMLDEV